jgi:hypothetical protein
MSFIDKIKYGNLNFKDKEISLKQDELSKRLMDLGIYDRLFEMPPPFNSSDETIRELKSCVKMIGDASETVIQFCQAAEDDYCQVFIDYLKRRGINDLAKEEMQNVIDQLDPLTFRLKEHYNRPRPYQLAYYYDLDLYVPIKTTGVDNPAYPSGHALEGYVMAELLAERYPDYKVGLLKLGKNIGLSRMIVGIHYKTDYDFGIYVAKQIIANDLVQL